MNPYQRGAGDALAAFTLEKTAIDWSKVWAGARQTAIGEPRRFWSELSAGTSHKPGGLLHEAVLPKSTFGKVLNWGLPALGLGLSLTAPPGQRGGAIGQSLGYAAGSTLGAPLGMLGQSVVGGLGSAVGGSLGRLFDRRPRPENAPFPSP